MPNCHTCSTFYSRHAIVCPRCHPLGLSLARVPQPSQPTGPQPGDVITYANEPGVTYTILETKTVGTELMLRIVVPGQPETDEWVYADGLTPTHVPLAQVEPARTQAVTA